MKRSTTRRRASTTRPFMTEAQYRELIQRYVERALADQRVAELLAAEARQRFGVNIDTSDEDG